MDRKVSGAAFFGLTGLADAEFQQQVARGVPRDRVPLIPVFESPRAHRLQNARGFGIRAVAADGDRRAKRKLGFIQRIQLRRWQDNVDERIGDRVSEEINNEDLQVAILRAVANGSDDEVAEWRADAEKARAKEDAA